MNWIVSLLLGSEALIAVAAVWGASKWLAKRAVDTALEIRLATLNQEHREKLEFLKGQIQHEQQERQQLANKLSGQLSLLVDRERASHSLFVERRMQAIERLWGAMNLWTQKSPFTDDIADKLRKRKESTNATSLESFLEYERLESPDGALNEVQPFVPRNLWRMAVNYRLFLLWRYFLSVTFPSDLPEWHGIPLMKKAFIDVVGEERARRVLTQEHPSFNDAIGVAMVTIAGEIRRIVSGEQDSEHLAERLPRFEAQVKEAMTVGDIKVSSTLDTVTISSGSRPDEKPN